MNPIVILGTGLAGYTLAKELRKLDADTPLVIISADDGRFYSKPMLSNALTKGKTANDLASASAEQMATQLKAEIRTHTRVTALHPSEKRIELEGTNLAYEKLVLCLGADPIRIPLEGDGADAVLSVNDLGDYARFRDALGDARRVMVLGAGLIGCEFANDLVNAGYEVAVADLADQPLARLLPPASGAALKDALAAAGVQWHLGSGAKQVDRIDAGYRIHLDNGKQVEADCVLSAIGLRPRLQLATAAGLAVNRGIVTDRLLQTSAADVYALGDCLEVDTKVLPFVMPIMNGARALAKTLAGMATVLHYPAMPVVVKTPTHPVVVAPPALDAVGNWRIEQDETGTAGFFENADGDLLGFVLTGARVSAKQALTKLLPPVMD